MHFLGFGDDPGSGGKQAEGGACFVGFGREVWVYFYFYQGSPCFGLWIPLRLVHFGFLGGIARSGGEWGEVEPCLIWPDC